MSEQEFIAEVTAQAPALLESLRADEGLFYLQVGTYSRHIQAQIDSGAVKELKQCLVLVEKALRQYGQRRAYKQSGSRGRSEPRGA